MKTLLTILLCAAPAAAQGTSDPGRRQEQAEALKQLRRVQTTVDGEISALDGTVVNNIVLAGDGRLALVLKQGDALIKSMEQILRAT